MVAEGESLYETVPEIARACERLPTDTLLDGEIIALDQNGRISFNLLQHHRSQAQALLFYAFDILIYRGENMMAASLVKRRKALDNLFDNLGNKAALISLSDTIDATPADLVRVVKEFGFEGIVAKRRDSIYESGKRSGAWVKHRINKGQEFVIGGYVPGHPLDSIIVGCYDDGKLFFAAKVRNGFVPRTRREVASRFTGLETDVCPFCKSAGKETHPMGFDKRRNEKLRLAKT